MGLEYLIPAKRVVGVCVVEGNDVHDAPHVGYCHTPIRWL